MGYSKISFATATIMHVFANKFYSSLIACMNLADLEIFPLLAIATLVK